MIEDTLITIRKEDLKKALSKAFNEGWSGFKDSEDSVIETLMQELKSQRVTISKFDSSTAYVNGDRVQIGESASTFFVSASLTY